MDRMSTRFLFFVFTLCPNPDPLPMASSTEPDAVAYGIIRRYDIKWKRVKKSPLEHQGLWPGPTVKPVVWPSTGPYTTW